MSIELRRKMTGGNYIPEIDGLRFIAIAWVVLVHAFGNWMAYVSPDWETTFLYDGNPFTTSDWIIYYFVRVGSWGVPLFFLISGFVLAQPFYGYFQENQSKVSLKSYFLRRVTRLEPPYIIVMVGYYLLLSAAGRLDWNGDFPNLLASLTYTHNIIYGTNSTIYSPAWSLEVEIQFYLVVPLLVYIFKLPVIARRSIIIAMMTFFSLTVYLFEKTSTLPFYLQYFLAGFLFCDLYRSRIKAQDTYAWSFDLLAVLCMVAWIGVANAPFEHGSLLDVGKRLFMPYLFFMIAICAFKANLFRLFLRLPFISLTGGMCYTIYLIHGRCQSIPYSTIFNKPMTGSLTIDYLIQLSVTTSLCAIVSCVLYVLIERPCMDKHWPQKLWSRIQSVKNNKTK